MVEQLPNSSCGHHLFSEKEILSIKRWMPWYISSWKTCLSKIGIPAFLSFLGAFCLEGNEKIRCHLSLPVHSRLFKRLRIRAVYLICIGQRGLCPNRKVPRVQVGLKVGGWKLRPFLRIQMCPKKGRIFLLWAIGYFGPINPIWSGKWSGFLGPSFYTPENERLDN